MRPPEARTWGALVRELAARTPEAPAIAFDGRRISYRELDEQGDGYARTLLAHGVRKGEFVSVLAGNRPEWLYVFLGTLRIGAVLAPLNTWFRDEELHYGLHHSGVKVLFAVDRFLNHDYAAMLGRIRHRLPALEAVLPLGGDLPQATDRELEAAQRSVRADDMCLLLYTSGSTARPKGVRLHHGAMLENCFNIGERMRLGPDDRYWVGSPLFYGMATTNALPACWTHGACIVIQESFDPGRALELIARERVTAFCGLGNMTRALLEHPDYGRRDLSTLDKGITGFSPEDKRLAITELGVARCCSVYGLTETYGNCALTDADDPIDVRLQTQGLPLPGWELKVVDPATEQELPVGEVGHLLVRGHTTSGYFDDADTTAAAFDGDGFFRTGDLASIDADGRMTWVARLKEVIKTGGINVSPREVEDLIDRHPDVRQVHVVGVPDAVKGEVVVAFVETLSDGLDEEAIRRFVADQAASFKVPARVLFRRDEELPRLASGKVPKYRLREEATRALTGGG
jgi:fatty-acyl-CoA synthase